jgi:hypothetical protein
MGPIAKAVTKAVNEWEESCPYLIDSYQRNVHSAYSTWEANPPEHREQYLMRQCIRRGKLAFHGISLGERLELMRQTKME